MGNERKTASKQDKFSKRAQNDTKLFAIGTTIEMREGKKPRNEIFGKDLREIPQVVTFFLISLLNIFIKYFLSLMRFFLCGL